jgi:glycerol uptake facilitator-like aquaporin
MLRQVFAEWLGTALLLCIVVGSGIMAERLAAGNLAIALLANTLATVCGLFVLIEVFGSASGAHFNPVVSLVKWLTKDLSTKLLLAYVVVQLLGAVAGVWLAHVMFDAPVIQVSTKQRASVGLYVSEVVATAGLIIVVMLVAKESASKAVAAYIGAAYWFTASTSFANPAAVLGRTFTDSFAGISPSSAPAFVIAQVVGAVAALLLVRSKLIAKQ